MQTLRDTFIDFIHIAYVESIYNNENLCEVLKLYFTFLYMCPPGPDSVYRTASTCATRAERCVSKSRDRSRYCISVIFFAKHSGTKIRGADGSSAENIRYFITENNVRNDAFEQ